MTRSSVARRKRMTSWIHGVLVCFLASASAVAIAQMQLQPEAKLKMVSKSDQLTDLPKTFNTLDLVARTNMKNGVSVIIWRYSTKYGEGGCDRGVGPVGIDAKTCPRVGLLISTRLELEDNSKFSLWSISDRQWWRVAGPIDSRELGIFESNGQVSSILLYACEASTTVENGSVDPSASDNWHAVPYRLEVGEYNQVSLKRLADPNPKHNCFGDNAPPRDPQK